MSHYEERLERDLADIRSHVAATGEAIGGAVKNSVHALLRRDRALAAQIILGDLPINRAVRDIDRRCHVFVARHLPGAGHLRYISSVLRMSVALERIGDYAVTIAREAVQLSDDVPDALVRDVEMLADHSARLLHQAMTAFDQGNAELARGAMGVAGQSKTTFQAVFADLLRVGEKGTRPIKDLFALLIVLNRLERVGNQAKNICEETIFAATGETKQPKVYRVLFVDEGNDFRSLIAEAIARKTFPGSGTYASAGWRPASLLDDRLVEFLDRHGHDVRAVEPTPLPKDIDTLNDYHVIVGFGGDVTEQMPEIPFHTAILRWTAGDDLANGVPDDERLEALYREIASEVRGLMETMHGEGAA